MKTIRELQFHLTEKEKLTTLQVVFVKGGTDDEDKRRQGAMPPPPPPTTSAPSNPCNPGNNDSTCTGKKAGN